MHFGKEPVTGTYKATSIGKGPDAAGWHTFALNCEGTVKGAWTGVSLMTMNAVAADLASGTCTASAVVSIDAPLSRRRHLGCSQPVVPPVRPDGFGLLADGRRFACAGMMALACRSLDGELYVPA
ncbi:MAG: hypothetical protein AB7Q81_03170 [Gammaproteobacteria bacterium]